MTTNVGFANAEQTKKNLGFVPTDKQLEDKKAKILKDELKEHFSPEFRNRLTNIFYFNSLSDESMALIVDKNIKRINQCLAEKGVTVEISEKAKKWIVSESLKENCGGRPVERIVDTEISEKVSEEVLFGELENGGKVIAELNKSKNGLTLNISK
jgi:ATP-dependent Clp protease ATP-binding subunit ClpA